MTPEQLLGIPTPESILGIENHADAKLSPDERFLKRQDQQAEAAVTNAWHQDLWGEQKPLWVQPLAGADDSPFARSADGSVPPISDVDRNARQLSGQDPSASLAQSERASMWSGPFASPPASKPTPEQVEGMERFRALLIPVDKAPTVVAGFGGPVAQPAHDPNFTTQPAYNPAGSPVKALVTGIAMPTGLTPLAGISGLPRVSAKRAPLVSPPPWWAHSTGDSAPPQRQY